LVSSDLSEQEPCCELCKRSFSPRSLITAELIILSRFSTIAGVILIGQQFSARSFLPFLNIGMIWAVFQSRGSLETFNDKLNSKERG
jgi:hypothetical protein